MPNSIADKIRALNITTLNALDLSDEQQIIKNFTETGIKTLGANFGFAWLKKEDQKEFSLAYTNPRTPYIPPSPRKTGINFRVFKTKKPFFAERIKKEPVKKYDQSKYAKSYIIIPIFFKQNQYGNIVICYKDRTNFSSEDKSLASAIGNATAHAITISRLYANLQASKDNLEATVQQRTEELLKTNDLLKQEIAERRKAQRELEASRHFIEQITNVVPGLIGVMEVKSGRYIYVNDALERVLGYQKKEFLEGGLEFVASLVHPDDAADLMEKNNAALAEANLQKDKFDDTALQFEYRLRHKNGEWRWLNTYGIVFSRDKNGLVEQLLNISVDITDRKNIEQRLKESEALLRDAQTIAHIGSWEWDVRSNIVHWSEEMCRIYGVPRGYQGSYHDYLSMVHHDDKKYVDEVISKVYKEKTSFNFFHRIVRADDEKIRTLAARGEAITNGGGEIVKMIGTGQDVTEQKEAEEKLRSYTKELLLSRKRLAEDKAKDEALLAGIGEGIIATDHRGHIILVNPQAERILGRKSHELLGRVIYDAQPVFDANGKEVSAQERPSFRALIKGQHVHSTKFHHIHYKKKNGALVPVSLTATPVFHKGKIIGFIQVFRDVTKEREIDRVKSELISLASHQLRTPLSAINWYTEALMKEEMGKLNKDQKRYLQEIFTANQKMVELVYDFLNVSRIELGTFTIKVSMLDITDITKSILGEIRPIALQKKIAITEQYGKGLDQVQGDRKIIRLILQNLITNAVKYSGERGWVKITVDLDMKTKKTPQLRLMVADNGYGIPRHQQDKVFTKLFRADNAAKMDTEGSGLGLYLVKSFVDFCNGKISFTSKENKGTTFFVTIPVQLPKVDKPLDKNI